MEAKAILLAFLTYAIDDLIFNENLYFSKIINLGCN